MSTLSDLDGVTPARLGPVVLDHISASRRDWQRKNRRPSALTAREALAALQFEALLVWVAASNIRHGATLTDEDFERLTTACRHIDLVCDEVIR
jgi:hypothetical protein